MNKQWTITIIILLMLLNVASIGFMWWKNMPPHFERRQEEKATEYIIHELNLDAKQQLAYNALLKSHREQMKEADRDLMKNKDAFFDLLQQELLCPWNKIVYVHWSNYDSSWRVR